MKQAVWTFIITEEIYTCRRLLELSQRVELYKGYGGEHGAIFHLALVFCPVDIPKTAIPELICRTVSIYKGSTLYNMYLFATILCYCFTSFLIIFDWKSILSL